MKLAHEKRENVSKFYVVFFETKMGNRLIGKCVTPTTRDNYN